MLEGVEVSRSEASGLGIGMVVGDGTELYRCTAPSGVSGDTAHVSPTGGAFEASDGRSGNAKRLWLAAGGISLDPSPVNGIRSNLKPCNKKNQNNSIKFDKSSGRLKLAMLFRD